MGQVVTFLLTKCTNFLFSPRKITLSYMDKTVTQIDRFLIGEIKSINSLIHIGYGHLTLGTENFAR